MTASRVPADIFEEIVRLRREGIPAALATIVGTRGSTPGREAMRLLVLEDGTFLGTVGGGCLEADVYEAAKEVIRDEMEGCYAFQTPPEKWEPLAPHSADPRLRLLEGMAHER